MPRTLIFAPDYGADPLWDGRDGRMIRLESLPISHSLRDSIREWAEAWQHAALAEMAAEDSAYPEPVPEGRGTPDTEWTRLESIREALVSRLRVELGEQYEVCSA